MKPVFQAAEGHTLVSLLGGNRSKKKQALNNDKSYAELLGPVRPGDSPDIVAARELEGSIGDITGSFLEFSGPPYDSSSTSFTGEPLAPVAPLTNNSSIPAKAPSHHGRDPADISSYGHAPPINSQALEYSSDSKRFGNQATSGDIVQGPPWQIPFTKSVEQQDTQSRPGGDKQEPVNTRPGWSYAHLPKCKEALSDDPIMFAMSDISLHAWTLMSSLLANPEIRERYLLRILVNR